MTPKALEKYMIKPEAFSKRAKKKTFFENAMKSISAMPKTGKKTNLAMNIDKILYGK